jgi:outer membrane protein
MQRRPAWLSFVLVVASATAAATYSPSAAAEGVVSLRAMSLAEARAHAHSHHQRTLAARRRLAAAVADANVPGAGWLPRVGAMAQIVGSTANNSTATILGTSAVDIPRIGGTAISDEPSFRPYPTTMVALGVRQQLFDFGRIAAETNAMRMASEVDAERVRGTELDVDLGVDQGFYAVLAAVAIEEAARGAFDRASQHRDLARANVTTGLRPPIELTRAEADVGRYEAALLRARAGVHVARSVFAVAVGVDEIELDATPLRRADEPLLPPLDVLVARSSAAPLVREARARADAQRAESERLAAQTRPNLFATAEISGRAGGAEPNAGPTPYGDGWLPSVPNYSAGVVLTWPVVEPTWSRREDASRAREQALATEADAWLRAQRGVIVGAYHDALAARSALDALRRGADAARANYEQADNRFRVGIGTSTELADAQALRTEADIQLAIGLFQVAQTRAVLARAVAEGR